MFQNGQWLSDQGLCDILAQSKIVLRYLNSEEYGHSLHFFIVEYFIRTVDLFADFGGIDRDRESKKETFSKPHDISCWLILEKLDIFSVA